MKYFCFLYTYVFAYVADDGGLIISPQTESDYLRDMAMKFVAAGNIPGNLRPIKHGKIEYAIPPQLIDEGAGYFFRCALPFKYTNWVDGDVAKYSVSHHERMLS